ncbi:MAG: ABC transporter permease subunit [Campylobacteraceae bacterium]|jgi:sulfate transport system permease protein|nr:ABC transporter permease subunit [Campylobacteraceae bacterium]
MGIAVKLKPKLFLFALSALSFFGGIAAAFADMRAFVVAALTSLVFVLIAFENSKYFSDKLNAKTALLGITAAIAFLTLLSLFANIDIRVSVTLFFIAGISVLTASNIETLVLKQTVINILFFAALLIISVALYINPSYTFLWILLVISIIAAIFANAVNSLLFFILFVILAVLYQNPNHALSWVSLIVFIIITAVVNKIGYKKSNPKLPGFSISLGLSLTYMSFLILIPLSALVLYSTQMPWGEFLQVLLDPRITTALKLSFGASFTAALINCFFGTLIAWALTRYDFLGKRIVDSVIDLPFAVPTAVAGISLAYIFSPNGVLGEFLQALTDKLHVLGEFLRSTPFYADDFRCMGDRWCFPKFLESIDLNVAYSKTGIILALVFIGLPFIVRTLQPVIEELDKELEEAASSLGANFYQIFRKVIFPSIYPALLTGFALAFARGLGEYGSVIFISNNMPYESEIVPLLIVKKLMQFDYVGASVIGVIMLIAAFILLLLINFLQSFARRRKKGK